MYKIVLARDFEMPSRSRPSVRPPSDPPLETTPSAQKKEKTRRRLEDEGGTLGLLVTTQLEVLAALEGKLGLGLGLLEGFARKEWIESYLAGSAL